MRVGKDAIPAPLAASSRSLFSDPDYDKVGSAGELQVKGEHMAAIAKAQTQLYGGLAGSRCDPVEEWPGDHDEAYGVPKAVREGIDPSKTYGEADRDDEKTTLTGKPVDLKRKVSASDL